MKLPEFRRPNDAMLLRILTILALAFGFGTSRGAWDGWAALYMASAVVGVLIAFGIVALWGERTRPRFNLLWLFILLILGAPIFATFAAGDPQATFPRIIPLAILVGLFIAHNNVLGPTLLIASPVFLAVFPPFEWRDATDGNAWMIAFTALFGLAAGTIERDRLHAQTSPPIPWLWTVIRLGTITIWTFVWMFFKEEIQVGSLFASFGLDPRGEQGRWALLALFLVLLVIATFLFRGKKVTPPSDLPPPTGNA